MTDAPEVKEDPKPELKVVPIEDLDKIEKLLDVAINCVQTPNLPSIKAACMAELKEIDDAMAITQAQAQMEYQKALAEWEGARAKKAAEAQAKVDAENEKREEAARKRGVPDTLAGSPRDTLASPRVAVPYPSNPPPVNGTIDRRI